MTPAAGERLRIRGPILCLTSAAWAFVLYQAYAAPSGCATLMRMAVPAPSAGATSAVSSAITGLRQWALMLAAMMVPTLSGPIRHVYDHSFADRRRWAIALFVAGYGAAWIGAGFVAVPVATEVVLFGSPPAAIMLGAIASLVWQCSPAKQHSLNRCHIHRELAAFGRAADFDALRFGVVHGGWCVSSCCALMVIPMLIGRGHLTAMAIVTLWILTERLDPPTLPQWRWRLPKKALRIAAAICKLAFSAGVRNNRLYSVN